MDEQTSRSRHLFDPSSAEFYPLSRSKLQLFLECPRCFYLDRRMGASRPDAYAYSLNLAVDHLLKKEFDECRARGEPHPVMTLFGVDAVPYRAKEFFDWRDSPKGMSVQHEASQFQVFGIVDDIWQHADGSLAVVDYKATSTPALITLDGRASYLRQIECYQWLLRRLGYRVSDLGYFVFANALKDRGRFDRTLTFSLQVLAHEGNAAWVEDALLAARETLMHDLAPPSTQGCEWCRYRRDARSVEG